MFVAVLDFSKHFFANKPFIIVHRLFVFFYSYNSKMHAVIIRAYHISMTHTKDGLVAKRKVSTSPNF